MPLQPILLLLAATTLTETATTVVAQHSQVDVDALLVSTETAQPELQLGFLGVTGRVGASDGVELDVVLPPLAPTLLQGGAAFAPGPVVARVKWAYLDGEGGAWALGVMPYAGIPWDDTATAMWGIAAPSTFALPAEISLSVMPGVEADMDGGVRAAASAAISRALVDRLTGYLEAAATLAMNDIDQSLWVVTAGVSFPVAQPIALDAGARYIASGPWPGPAGTAIAFLGFSAFL